MKISYLNDQIPEITTNRNNLIRKIHRHEANNDKRYHNILYMYIISLVKPRK